MKVVTIKFPPDHDNRLRRLGIKKQFLRNIAAAGWDVEVFALRSIEHKWTWNQLIYFAFPWRQTPEGWEFWEGIANYKTRK